MSGLVILIIMVVALVVGYLCNNSFKKINGEDGFLILPGVIQTICLIVTFLNIPNPDITGWFIGGLVCTIISYIVAIIMCYKAADENGAFEVSEYVRAILAQILIPLSAALLIIFVLAILISRKERKKRR